jgi:hypothetical protein
MGAAGRGPAGWHGGSEQAQDGSIVGLITRSRIRTAPIDTGIVDRTGIVEHAAIDASAPIVAEEHATLNQRAIAQ